jgi:hypothetical protein
MALRGSTQSIAAIRTLSRADRKAGGGAIKSEIRGLRDLDRAFKRLDKNSRQAAKAGVSSSSRRVQLKIRREVNRLFSGSGLKSRRGKGRKIGNAVRRLVFDNGRDGSAALIFSKFGRREGGRFVDYLGPYLTGQDIKPKRAKFLAIPLQPGKRNKDPAKFKDLDAIEINGRLFLVRHTRSRSLFMFMLIPRIKVRRRLRPARIARRELRRMPEAVRREFKF